MDALHEIELQVLQLLALVIGSAIVWALQKVAAWVGLKLDAHRIDMLNAAVDKAMTFGVTKADAVIRANGWDHVDSKNQVIDFALNAIEDRFSDTLKANKIDLTDAASRAILMQMMERM